MKLNILLLGLLLSLQSFGQRSVSNINEDWLYLEKPLKAVKAVEAEKNWEEIDLPHSWNSLDATDQTPGYRRSASWYKKTLHFDQLSEEKRYLLYFEGANLVTKVYVNGQLSGGHIGGYIGFEIDITEQLQQGNNTVLVRVDNSYNREIIPSQKSDFFIFGGITRDVWLKEVSSTYITQLKISTPEVSATRGLVQLEVKLNKEATKKSALKFTITKPNDEIVHTESINVGGKNLANISFEVRNPKLWQINDPAQYQASVELIQKNKSVDRLTDQYGYRWFEFKDYGGFFLNGERVLLRGTHRHEEHAGYGAAMPNKLHRRDIELIKEMGANFVRLGHYPQDPEVYKACNELGIMIWDELPWCRGGLGNDTWKANTKNMLKEIITQNYNHPSIIMWSLGNEIYWLPDFENGDNREEINIFLNELNDMAHSMDAQRKTSIRKYYEGSDIVDVFSPSIWSGWYSGSYKNYEKAVQKSFEKYPHFIHMEYGGSSHFGRHSENPIDGDGVVNPSGWEEAINQVEVVNIAQTGDWSENYIVDLFDWHLRTSETFPNFIGNAQWALKDFGTPLRPENDIPYMNQKGLMDRSGNPKDAYYVFKSYWSDDPFAYIESHTWTERSGPKDLARNISVFSNGEAVELFHNGKSLGKKLKDINQFPACGLNWDINFTEGKNSLQAIVFKSNERVAEDNLDVNYRFEKAAAPQKLALSYKKLTNGNYLVIAEAQDKKGLRSLNYEEKVYFQCLNGGELVESLGTPNGSSVINMANGYASIEVIPHQDAEEISISLLNQSFKGSFLNIIHKQ